MLLEVSVIFGVRNPLGEGEKGICENHGVAVVEADAEGAIDSLFKSVNVIQDTDGDDDEIEVDETVGDGVTVAEMVAETEGEVSADSLYEDVADAVAGRVEDADAKEEELEEENSDDDSKEVPVGDTGDANVDAAVLTAVALDLVIVVLLVVLRSGV